MMKRIFLGIMVVVGFSGVSYATDTISDDKNLFYFCTAANEKYYPHLLNLIGSIHQHNFYELGHIAVFDLGLLPHQREQLLTIEKVSVHSVEQTNPEMLQMFYTQPDNEKPALGWYSWKPVAIKQAFELFPQDSPILWIDAGTTVLKDISLLFACTKHQGYFFHNGWDWPLKRHTTQFLIESLNLHAPEREWILGDTVYGLEAGLMGLSRNVYDNFILPMYEHSKDIRYFVDDGSAPEGFGYAHHDQTLFSIYAHLNNFNIINHFEDPRESFALPLPESERNTSFHVASLSSWKTKKSAICCSRNDLRNFKTNVSYIYYQNSKVSELRKLYHSAKVSISQLVSSSFAATKAYIVKLLKI